MSDISIIWDLPDDPTGNVHHIAMSKAQSSPQHRKLLQEVRKEFQAKPSIEELIDSKKYRKAIPFGEYLQMELIARELKAARIASGLSLTEVASATGMDRSAISRIENGTTKNVTISTLNRLAKTYGRAFHFALRDVSASH
ncbi:helix-turn-helix domain-containing protein [Lacunimicrobium album]